MQEGWPTKEEFPYRALIRILPPTALQLAVANAVEQAAQTITQKEAQGQIREAVNTAVRQLQGMEVRTGAGTVDNEQCGTGLATLLVWLANHPKPHPQPDPFYNLATIGIIGQVIEQAGGQLQKQVIPALQAATKLCAR